MGSGVPLTSLCYFVALEKVLKCLINHMYNRPLPALGLLGGLTCKVGRTLPGIVFSNYSFSSTIISPTPPIVPYRLTHI